MSVKLKCPNCNSIRVVVKGAHAPPLPDNYHCVRCGADFNVSLAPAPSDTEVNEVIAAATPTEEEPSTNADAQKDQERQEHPVPARPKHKRPGNL